MIGDFLYKYKNNYVVYGFYRKHLWMGNLFLFGEAEGGIEEHFSKSFTVTKDIQKALGSETNLLSSSLSH